MEGHGGHQISPVIMEPVIVDERNPKFIAEDSLYSHLTRTISILASYMSLQVKDIITRFSISLERKMETFFKEDGDLF